MKRCPACNKAKARRLFHRDRARPDGLQSICGSCRKKYDAFLWQKNKQVRQAQKRQNYLFVIALLRRYKAGNPCSDCKGSFHPVAMQFDHMPGTNKTATISSVGRQILA